MGMHNMQHGISKEIEMAMEATGIVRGGRSSPTVKPSSRADCRGSRSGVLEKGAQPAIKGSHRFGVTLIEVPVGMGANWHPDVLRAAEGTGLAYDNTGYLAESVS